MTTTTTVIDTEDQFNWNSITKTFDQGGNLTNRFTLYDDDTTSSYDYASNGRFLSRVFTDSSQGSSAKNWESITYTYNVEIDKLDSKEIIYDNGIVKQFTYETTNFGNSLSSVVQYDTDNIKSWQERSVYYEDDGTIEKTSTIYDNQTATINEYANGNLERQTQFDISEDGSAKSWAQIITRYDAAETGLVTSKDIIYDNGLVALYSTVAGGELKIQRKLDTEDAFNYEDIFYEYDNVGELHRVVTVYDNGVVKFVSNDADGGKTDIRHGENSNAANFDEIIFEYAADGDIETRYYDYKSGDKKGNTYDDEGDIETSLFVDYSDTRSWFAREYVYDAQGNITDTIYHQDTSTIDDSYWQEFDTLLPS